MDDTELNQLVDEWIGYQKWYAKQPPPVGGEYRPFPEEPPEYADRKWERAFQTYELLWQFIVCAYQRELSDQAIAILAAGPVEDLLSGTGADYIDRVEELAKRDDKFNELLGGVWQNGMTNDVWKRLQRVRRTVW
jgi:hypothetical protein